MSGVVPHADIHSCRHNWEVLKADPVLLLTAGSGVLPALPGIPSEIAPVRAS